MRRSEMAPRSARAMARKSIACATICPWKLPPLLICPLSGKTSGLSVALLTSISSTRRT